MGGSSQLNVNSGATMKIDAPTAGVPNCADCGGMAIWEARDK